MLVGAGDIAECPSNGDEATAKLLDTIEGTVFTLGDNAYERGTADEYRRCYAPTWGRELERTRPVAGNHDYATDGAAGYFDYFGAAAGDPGKGWYAYDAGAWRVYALNSNCAAIGGCEKGSAEQRWLREDLAANPRSCVLAMWHHPRFSSGRHGNNTITEDLWRALYEAGAELIVNGHDHTYERFAPQSPDALADPQRGIVEIVAGTGGRSHYEFPVIRANSLVRNNTTFGVLRLTCRTVAGRQRSCPRRTGASPTPRVARATEADQRSSRSRSVSRAPISAFIVDCTAPPMTSPFQPDSWARSENVSTVPPPRLSNVNEPSGRTGPAVARKSIRSLGTNAVIS